MSRGYRGPPQPDRDCKSSRFLDYSTSPGNRLGPSPDVAPILLIVLKRLVPLEALHKHLVANHGVSDPVVAIRGEVGRVSGCREPKEALSDLHPPECEGKASEQRKAAT